MRRRPPRSTQSRSSAASDVYKRQQRHQLIDVALTERPEAGDEVAFGEELAAAPGQVLSLIHISEPTRPY